MVKEQEDVCGGEAKVMVQVVAMGVLERAAHPVLEIVLSLMTPRLPPEANKRRPISRLPSPTTRPNAQHPAELPAPISKLNCPVSLAYLTAYSLSVLKNLFVSAVVLVTLCFLSSLKPAFDIRSLSLPNPFAVPLPRLQRSDPLPRYRNIDVKSFQPLRPDTVKLATRD
jgi:hypothetical protein